MKNAVNLVQDTGKQEDANVVNEGQKIQSITATHRNVFVEPYGGPS